MGKHDRFDEEFYNPRDVASQSTVALSLAELPGVRDHGISVRKDEYFGHLINLCNDAIISDIGAGRETFEAQLTKNGRGNEALRNYSFFLKKKLLKVHDSEIVIERKKSMPNFNEEEGFTPLL